MSQEVKAALIDVLKYQLLLIQYSGPLHNDLIEATVLAQSEIVGRNARNFFKLNSASLLQLRAIYCWPKVSGVFGLTVLT